MTICVKCKKRMRMARVGIIVRRPNNICSAGDLVECPQCGAQIITGFGNTFTSDKPIKEGYVIEMDS